MCSDSPSGDQSVIGLVGLAVMGQVRDLFEIWKHCSKFMVKMIVDFAELGIEHCREGFSHLCV